MEEAPARCAAGTTLAFARVWCAHVVVMDGRDAAAATVACSGSSGVVRMSARRRFYVCVRVCVVCVDRALCVCVCAMDAHPHEPAVCGGRGLHRRSQTYWSTVTHRHAGLATPRIAQLCSRPAVSGTTCQQASATLPSPPPPLLRHLNHPHHHRHHGEGELSNQPTS